MQNHPANSSSGRYGPPVAVAITHSEQLLARCFASLRSASHTALIISIKMSKPLDDRTFRLTKTPNPDWKLGDEPQSSPLGDEMVDILPTEVDGSTRYKLLIGGVAPRPIAFVSSISADGKKNLAPFSYFNILSHDPPTIMISVCRNSPDRPKDTARNILETKEFVVNIISEWFVEAANFTSIDAPFEVSEWDLSKLTETKSQHVKPSRVAQSAYQMECKLHSHHPLVNAEGKITTDVIFGSIVVWHINKKIMDEKYHIDYKPYQPVSRLGGVMYGRTTDGYEIPRPKYEDIKDK